MSTLSDTHHPASTHHGAGIQVRRIYDDPAPTDGTRVLVDRLWPRGMSKEHAALDLWLKDIAPSTELREWFGHDPARWAGFCERYRAELESNPACVEQLETLAKKGPLTLLFGAKNTEENEAVVLAAYLLERSSQ
ncbi:DUF488 domain-containing protein [Acetobacter orleanensis]|uniref:Uroporphyrin-III methyltransferase n=1 Tax=Acetobacter orleanensis TaxID=104099 RepID=A0A4Y3TL60_9PROT|nr:DUF488 domain-containing protein [Acetobacter orleanensis]KXV63922.1 uroporphyrin-III methyltransferase [Acetobacter orleanensis]PCD79693.1 DUF488 domain-containing protein [Acetobacter orleanensis]GAN69255.1 hypothetical protein Abol_030_020 [Acetobacter orleanensis JCM 7639]GBR28193.1 hypothetical protein AA0473_1670 [Acetobacter orleanensis NRIC 0473]GEB82219.1 hypothetical protein AOR01nite_06960 [Acetobacter orleanensis]